MVNQQRPSLHQDRYPVGSWSGPAVTPENAEPHLPWNQPRGMHPGLVRTSGPDPTVVGYEDPDGPQFINGQWYYPEGSLRVEERAPSASAHHGSAMSHYNQAASAQSAHIAALNQQTKIMEATLADQMKHMGYQEQQIAVIIEQMRQNAAFGEKMTQLLEGIQDPGPGRAVHMVGY